MTGVLVAREGPFVWHMDLRPWVLLFEVQFCLGVGLIAFLPTVKIGLALWSIVFSLALAVSIWGMAAHGPRTWPFQPLRQPLLWEVASWTLWALVLWGGGAGSRDWGAKPLATVFGLVAISELYVYLWGTPGWSKRSWEKLHSGH